jgi:hypothetical protein
MLLLRGLDCFSAQNSIMISRNLFLSAVDKERERKEVESWNAFVDQWFAEREHLVPPETSTGAKRKVKHIAWANG